MLKFLTGFLMMTLSVWAQNTQPPEKVNLDMCGSAEYRFDQSTNECIYCAHGMNYDENLICVGTPNLLGKCYGDHHYHAATGECMFCAKTFSFNETSRKCELTKNTNEKGRINPPFS